MLPPRDRPIASLVALSERELGLFFPGDLRAQLRTILKEPAFHDPLAPAEEWSTLLDRIKPDILVSGWRTPALPPVDSIPRYVCHVAGTVKHVLTRDMLDRGLLVTNWGPIMTETVAEGTLGMMLAALRKTQFFGELMHRKKGWAEAPAGTSSLFGRKVGIYGFGGIARNLIPLLRPFRCEIAVHSIGVPVPHYAEHGVRRSESLEELFSWADVLVVAEASTPKNKGIVGEALLRRLHSQAVFVNVARGALVREDDVVKVAKETGLRVALDVYDPEPLPAESPLRGIPNITLMPHMAGVTTDRIAFCGEAALRNLQNYLSNGEVTNVVTREIYDRST